MPWQFNHNMIRRGYASSLSGVRSSVKRMTCEDSDFTPCVHEQSNILHTKYPDKTDFWGLGIRV